MRAWCRDHGLLLANLGLFVVFFVAMALSGGLAYNAYQSAQPQTLAYALQDSPAGWLAWVTQLFQHAGDRLGERPVTDQFRKVDLLA